MAEMAEAASQADTGVPGHSERVTCYAVQTAQAMGLRPDEVSLVRQAAALHDIGKIALSEDIVGKLGRLTDTEFGILGVRLAGY
jgi:HD-GYP domain-containing protein (c-di-GMP phosphodiesterase class II)